jgi:glycosyltransferase involved in cell wall biosynthesis
LPATTTPAAPGGATTDVAILGGWTWKSNREGLQWFLHSVHPLLPSELRVEIGGAASDDYASGIAGVTAHGRVPDALAFLQSARVVAVPSVQGAGVQVKTIDAIASGRPVVATATAMRGIDDPPPTVRVAAAPEDFAQALGDAVRDGASPELARVAQDWAASRRARFEQDLAAALAAVR